MTNLPDFDINILLDKFSYHFGNKTNDLLEFAQENGFENPELIIKDLQTIQSDIYNYVWEITSPDKRLTGTEIQIISQKYLTGKYNWINEMGIEAINRWLFWMTWREGILK